MYRSVFLLLNECLQFSSAFYQYSGFVIDDLNKTAGNVEAYGTVFVFQHFYFSLAQSTYHGGVFFQYFEQAAYTGELNAVHVVAKELFFGSQYF